MPRLLTAREFASEISVPLRTVQHWCARGRIPCVRRINHRGEVRILSSVISLYKDGLVPLALTDRQLA